MELYRKKINIGNKVSRRLIEKYNEADNPPKNLKGNSYLKKMIEKKHAPQRRGEALNLSFENINNVRSNVEDILSNENSKKKAIRYVIKIGKNNNIPTNTSYDNEHHYGRSESPKFRERGYPREYVNSYKNSPDRNLNVLQPSNKYISINENNNQYLNEPKRGYNDSSKKLLSSFVEEERKKNQEPRIMGRINRVLQDRYENAMRKPQERRNRNIQAMPRVRKHTPDFGNYTVIYGTNKEFDNNDIDDLINVVDDLQITNKNLQKDINNKNRELNMLRNELDNVKKELDDRRIEHDKELDEML